MKENNQLHIGYGLSDNRTVSNSAASRTLAVLPCSSCLDHKSRVNNGRVKCVAAKWSFVCRASSGGHRRNPDFSRQNKHGFRGRNKQNEERYGFDGFEDSEMFSSKNGPVVSLSNSPKFQATSSPGPREREIVELFRKVQAQLRARAAAKKEGKKVEEASRGQGKESETVDSLLKLLRKHSGEQSKKKEVNSGQADRDVAHNQDQSSNSINSRDKSRKATSFTRPASSFRRKSPVPRYKSQPTYSSESWTQKKDRAELHDGPEDDDHEAEPEDEEPEPGTEPAVLEQEPDLKPESFYQDEDDAVVLEQISDDAIVDADEGEEPGIEMKQDSDFSALKLTELRAIAKSRGVKGFSKMKKAELVELLSSGSNLSHTDGQ
ncbi:PREDICTED: rho-N domain-containing protein 1, chloroplastic-like isoform X2 [Tarenaya hassleriana]|uniref:rho-N domain-containing protein 1, chloroplastic-like isoform X2 n=1 Tax=Tarenaya hassleriana TaxID=28532 RepID=UPI00053C1A2A|nr:PREDICTED: rho-N domain-containing protein 1, chloroplastic-like isoform X2 [Tarenaya hassleriana]